MSGLHLDRLLRPRTALARRLATVCVIALLAAPAFAQSGSVTALGRLEPADGVLQLSGPSRPAVVIAELLVDEGDLVEKGQKIAVLDSYRFNQAQVERLEAELERAELELGRTSRLARSRAASDAKHDSAELAVAIAKANLSAAQAELEQSVVRAPIAARVLEVHARAGERLGPEGIVELGRTDEMYAIAEVYETDIGRVREQQRARVTSPALPEPVEGTVERIALKVGKQDLVGTDPISKADARVVEVEIKLDDAEVVANLTNLQVEVEILP